MQPTDDGLPSALLRPGHAGHQAAAAHPGGREGAAVLDGMDAAGGPSVASSTAQADAVAAVTAAADPSSPMANSALPAILGDVPVAVLLIDQRTGEVTFANAAAMDLAGDVTLPVSADGWGAAAGLTDLDGQALAGTSAPLSRVVGGLPLAGEPVRLSPRRSDDPARADAHGRGDDQLLWVTGFPMTSSSVTPDLPDASGEGPVLSLVVFLPVADPQAEDGVGAEAVLQRLREGAVLATDICFAITDPRQDDDPLVWVNPSFTRVTGYTFEESVGRNCRFLQGPATDVAGVDELRAALRGRRSTTVTLLNYRKDGTAFWNQLSVSPVFDGEGELVSFVGVQSDVSQRVLADAERARAMRAETAAREVAERAQKRLLIMAEGTSQLVATLDTGELLERLVTICVPALADWAFVVGLDEHGSATEAAAAHGDGPRPELARLTDGLTGRYPQPSSPVGEVISRNEAQLLSGLDPADVATIVGTDPVLRPLLALGVRGLLTIPMTARGRTLGVLSLARTDSEHAPDDVEVALDLARRAAMAIDNARLYQQEQSVAETLQRSLLPVLPDIEGVTAVAHYQSASSAAAVGGDFYDLLQLPGGAIGLAIGDVAGHDINAAAEMGQLRALLRACAYEGSPTDPGQVLDRLDRLVVGLGLGTLATVTYACAVSTGATGDGAPGWELHVATAGHPPLVVLDPEGAVRQLDDVRGMMLGVDPERRRRTFTYGLASGSTVLAYTDGLVEHRGADLDVGTAELLTRLGGLGPEPAPATVCAAAMHLADNRLDDVACMSLTLH